MKRIWLLILWLGFLMPSQAQQNYIDSLQNLLKHTAAPVEMIMIQQRMADWYRSNEQYPEAIKMAEESLQRSQQLSENNLEVTKAYWILSNIYCNLEDFEKSKLFIDKAYKSAEGQHSPIAMAYAHYASAMLYSTLFDSERCVKLIHAALSKIPDPNKEALLTARIYYLLYGVYTEWNDESKSLYYAQQAVTYAEKSGNKNMLANAYAAIAVVFSYKYEAQHKKEYLDSIMQPLDNAISLFHKYPGQVVNNTYAHCHNNKASYYLKYYNTTDPQIKQKIRDNVQEALRIAPSSNDVAIASGYGMLSELSMQENDLPTAENYLTKAYTLILQKKKPYYHTLISVLNSLVTLSTKKNDFKKALEYQQKIAEYSNLLFNEEAASNTKRLEAQFELSKKEQEIKTLHEKSESQKIQKYLLIGVICLGILGAFFMFRSYHFNLRYSLAREKQLTAERHEATLQIKYEKEEQARLKAEQELLALQQQKLQNEVMASQLQLQHKTNVLHQLKEKLSSEEPVNIHQILRAEALSDNDFEKAKFRIQEVHPNFFKNLNEITPQKLTSLDQKYCAYLYLGMDTKQIAHLLQVAPKSVRMTKYRLKQKFGLDADTDLVNFIKEVI